MATADELLAMMAEDGTVYDDDICFADQDTRTVAIPERLKIIGVENDDDVAVRRFRVPAICCGTDLSAFEIRVNFENAKKERDCYFVTDAVVDGDCIVFSWRVDRVALRYKGKLRFAIHMELLDADGFIEKEWNSAPAHFDVLEGLEVELTPEEEETARAAATQLVLLLEKEGENQIAAVEAAGAETIASIPEDYTALASEVDQLPKNIQTITDTDPDMVDLSGVSIVGGGYIASDGTIGANSNLCYTEDYIEIQPGWKSLVTNRKVKLTSGEDFLLTIEMVKFYKEDKSPITVVGEKTGDFAIYAIPTTAAYARFNLGLLSPVKYVRVLKHDAVRYRRHAQAGDSVDNFDQSGLYLIAANVSAEVENNPFSEGDGGLIQVYSDIYGNVNQLAFSRFRDVQTRISSKSNGWSSWRRAGSDKIGEYTGTFTELNQRLDTGIVLQKGRRYLIRKKNEAENLNVFVSGNTSDYKRIFKWHDDMYFTPSATGNLMLYNYSAGGYVGEVSIEVIAADRKNEVKAAPKVYTVGKTAANYDYTSVTQCLLDLKDDHSPKTIYIDEGDYDIYAEYKAAGVPVYTGDNPALDYFDYCVWVPKNTHIIGRGIVRLMWMPGADTGVTYNESATVSPVNCAGSMTLENVEIHCKNGRYCIHDDPLGKAEFTNAIKKYINVRCYKYANDSGLGWTHAIGFGLDRTMRCEFHNCLFKNTCGGRAFYMHTRNTVGGIAMTEAMSSNLIVSNCVMDTNGAQCVKLGNSSNNCHVRVDFNSCWFSGYIDLINESSTATSTYRNAWDLKLLNCNEVDINIADPDNLYPPQVYGR